MSKRQRFSDDPVMRACQTKTASFRWSELSSLIPLSPYQAEVLTNAERAGIGEGFTVPASIPGECLGSCSFAVRTGQNFDERILPAVQYVGSFAFEAARRLAQTDALTRDMTDGMPVLSPRQLDCLVLIAQGKSDVDTAQLLGLSKSTVHEYVENAKRKYGVASRVQLIIRTLSDNQLGFECTDCSHRAVLPKPRRWRYGAGYRADPFVPARWLRFKFFSGPASCSRG